MNIDQLTEQAVARLATDPTTARAFDAAARCTATTRRAAVLATLAAAREKQIENNLLRQRRDASRRRVAALQAAAAIASKPASSRPAAPAPQPPVGAFSAMRSAAMARVQAAAAQPAVDVIKSRPDRRQGDLPLEQWQLEHLFRLGIAGDSAALAEIRRRGFAIGPHGLSKSLKA